MHWSFELTPTDGGTGLRHTFWIPRPEAGADELASFIERTGRIATVRTGMRRTLHNVKTTAEPG